ncbi:MAG: N,N'-diacetylbacillosaminyl-diphospho-undecaprenol alpha-1,3-N-acetylgalactosaminyltransferase [Syntrophomonadaceae bacterium]|nr:N,N'-diacetylbacillosaminyl-diphospho-undecaprenol alpha-1,3-N-acetylgalactosaminyltransferase [Bacillota bacterium]
MRQNGDKRDRVQSKKILIVSSTTQTLYNFRIGLLRALRDNKFDVRAIAKREEFDKKLEEEGFKCIFLQYLDRKGVNPIEDIKLMLELRRIYREEKPDLIIHYTIKPNIYGSIVSRFTGTTSFCMITGLGYAFTKKGVLLKVVKLLYKISLGFTKKIFFQNDDDRKLFIEEGIAPSDKSVLLSGGVDTEYFSPEVCRNLNKKNSNNLSFLLIARMLWDKGIGEFVKAAGIVKKRFPDTEFQLLGFIDKGNPSVIPEGKIKDWEREGLIKHLGSTDDVRPFICKSSCVVLPSYREGIPHSLLEAMAMAKPIITTDSAGCKEVVENGKNGFLVPVKDAEALASAIERFINLSEVRKIKMGEYSREKAIKEFDEKPIIKICLKHIEDALRSTKFKNISGVKR